MPLDEWTRQGLRELARKAQGEERQHDDFTKDRKFREYDHHLNEALKLAGEICNCADCARKRMQNEIIQQDKAALIEGLREKLVGNPIGFIPDLSSNPEHWRITPVRRP